MLSLFAFLFLTIAIFAIFALQLFGGHYKNFPGGEPRANFDTFPKAWLTIFQVTSSDQWMSITWKAMQNHWVRPLLFPPNRPQPHPTTHPFCLTFLPILSCPLCCQGACDFSPTHKEAGSLFWKNWVRIVTQIGIE